jgi:hypothetical protein
LAAVLTDVLNADQAALTAVLTVAVVVLVYAAANAVARVEYAAATAEACVETAAPIALSLVATACATQAIAALVAADIVVVVVGAGKLLLSEEPDPEPLLSANAGMATTKLKIMLETPKIFLIIFFQ